MDPKKSDAEQTDLARDPPALLRPAYAVGSWCERIFCGGWCTTWSPPPPLAAAYPPRRADFRDRAPPPLAAVYAAHAPVVRRGRWTFGLLEMWFPRGRYAKQGVHIPCWDSCRASPRGWRGACFGKTCAECYWTGLQQTRFARYAYAAGLGAEYVYPVKDVGRDYRSDITALCWLYALLGCVVGCGVGQLFSLCGNVGANFAAFYSCHARERMRRKWGLPPAFGLPPGIDDCLVHFLCLYCATHQEMRELAARGVDGPGLHVLDVCPASFAGAPGGREAAAARRRLVEAMLAAPPRIISARVATPPGSAPGSPAAPASPAGSEHVEPAAEPAAEPEAAAAAGSGLGAYAAPPLRLSAGGAAGLLRMAIPRMPDRGEGGGGGGGDEGSPRRRQRREVWLGPDDGEAAEGEAAAEAGEARDGVAPLPPAGGAPGRPRHARAPSGEPMGFVQYRAPLEAPRAEEGMSRGA